jgi:hypothetical protein
MFNDAQHNWLQIPEPIKQAFFLGNPMAGYDYYFFMTLAIGSFGGGGRTTGYKFGAVKERLVIEFQATYGSEELKMRRYDLDKFPYDRKILKPGCRI